MLFFTRPAVVTACLPVEMMLRPEPAQLLLAVHVVPRDEVLLGGTAAIADDQRWRVGGAAGCRELDHVLVEWEGRHGVLDAAVPVHHVRDVELEVTAALVRRRDSLLPRRDRHPLPPVPITDEILLQRLGLQKLGIPSDYVAG